MSIKSRKTTNILQASFAGIAAVLLSLPVFANTAESATDDAAEARTSESIHFSTGGRDNARDPAKGLVSVDAYPALTKSGTRGETATRADAAAPGASAKQTSSYDFWFYDADIDLFYDDDGDGYFYGVDLWFDADTIYNDADVYVVVYLSYEGGPWNEYAVSDDFTIFGTSANDDYVIVTELMSGYPTGEYDLLIEMFDSWTGDFLASFGPSDTSELAYLPLEDFNRDAPVVEDRVVVVTQSGGGAFGIWMLLGLLTVGLYGRRL